MASSNLPLHSAKVLHEDQFQTAEVLQDFGFRASDLLQRVLLGSPSATDYGTIILDFSELPGGDPAALSQEPPRQFYGKNPADRLPQE